MADFIIEFLGHKYPVFCPSNEKEICKNYQQRFISCGQQFKAKLEGILQQEIKKTPTNAAQYNNEFKAVVKLIDEKIAEKINEYSAKCADKKSAETQNI